MNQWEKIWSKRTNEFNDAKDIFSNFVELKKANGFDIQQQEGYYESFYEQFQKMIELIKQTGVDYTSVYEVGCGSGVNLYLFKELCKTTRLGGIDYSSNLVEIASKVIGQEDIRCGGAHEIDEKQKYDLVLSDSVFQYFQTEEYGYEVLQKMYEKASKMVIIKEIHDKEREEEHLRLRRASVENYDEKYKGLEKTFYSKDRFIQFATEHGCDYKIIAPDNESYWNNQFVFDFYLIKR